MMWNKNTCPICGSQIIVAETIQGVASNMLYSNTFYKCQYSVLTMIKGEYKLEPHFKMQRRDGEAYHETFFIFPYIVDSYHDVSNIYIYERDRSAKSFIVEVPHLDLPWDNKDKVLQKLKLYTVFS